MNAGFLGGQQFTCLCMLGIIVVSILADRKRGRTLDVLLCAAALLFGAVTLDYMHWLHAVESGLGASSHPNRELSVTLTAAGGGAAILSFFLWRLPKPHALRWAGLLAALLPLWLMGLYWVLTKDVSPLSCTASLSLLTARLFYQLALEEELKKRAEDMENRQAVVFQWQMRPHFIFNSLSTIRTLIDTDPALAASGLENLSGYLRKNIDALTQETLIPFERELEHIEQYVTLEKMNPANRFEVIYDLRVIDFSLPALSVQPLVENAIRYGVRALGEEGMIFVSTERYGGMIRIVVEDNGPGFPKSTTEQQEQRASHGLENARRRLESQCGGSLHIHSGGDGTRLVVLIPKRD